MPAHSTRWLPGLLGLAAAVSLAVMHRAVCPGRAAPRWAVAAYGGGPPPPPTGQLTTKELLGILAASALLGAVVSVLFLLREDLAALQAAFAAANGFTVGDVTGAALWSAALWFTSPYQVLVLFFGKFEGERPSTWLLARVSQAQGRDPGAADYQPTALAYIVTLALTAAGGVGAAAVLEASLGQATWAVSSGLGLCMLAGVFEAGRPKALTLQEAGRREELWQVFQPWAEQKLQRRGQCHYTDVDEAFRRYPPHGRFRTPEGLSDEELKRLIGAWAPNARRTSTGFYKGLSLAPAPAAGRGVPEPEAPPPLPELGLLDELTRD